MNLLVFDLQQVLAAGIWSLYPYLCPQVVVLISLFLQSIFDVLQLFIGPTPVLESCLLADHLTDRQRNAKLSAVLYCRKWQYERHIWILVCVSILKLRLKQWYKHPQSCVKVPNDGCNQTNFSFYNFTQEKNIYTHRDDLISQ